MNFDSVLADARSQDVGGILSAIKLYEKAIENKAQAFLDDLLLKRENKAFHVLAFGYL